MRFRVLFEQAAAGVAQLQTATGKLVKVNRRLCEILGYAEEELLELTFKTITHPDDLGQDLENMRRLRSGEIRDFSMEKRYIRKDGTVIWASLSVSPMWLPGEEPEYNIGVVLDITERKRIETELYESRARYQQLFETAPVSTLEEDYSDAIEMLAGIGMEGDVRSRMTDHPGLVAQAMFAIKGLQANESAVALFGARSEADLLESLHKTVPFESYKTFSEQLAALISGKTSFQSETVKYTLDGRRIDIIEHVQAVGGSDRLDRVLVSHTDITALKQAERSLRRSGELLSTVINSIDSAISIIDVRNDSVLACNASFPRNAATGRGDSIRNSR
jgi:PAS domain S-box-containing protein